MTQNIVHDEKDKVEKSTVGGINENFLWLERIGKLGRINNANEDYEPF